MSVKVIKPLLLGFLWRTYKRQGNNLSLSGFVAFPFANPDIPHTEQEMWNKVGPLFPPNAVWDEGIPKDRGEVLLLGSCYASGGTPVTRRRITVRVGPVTKSLDVFGDRNWIRPRGILEKSPAEPFTAIPIDYSHAFGGPEYGPNPTGKGFLDPSDGFPRPIPNIEDPFRPLESPDDRPEPSGFGPLELVWTQRKSRIGQYRPDELLGNEPPPLPENTDWTVYNQAPTDQWLSGYWQGGEEFSLEGLHPETDLQESHLPRIMLRSFVFFKGGQTTEVPLHPETVWLFPGLSMGVVIHRGSLPIESDDASEVGAILLGAEDPGENRPIDHYLAVKSRRDKRDPNDLSRFGDAPLLPERLSDDPRANLLDVNEILEGKESEAMQRAKRITSHRLDGMQEKIDKARESLSTLSKPSPSSGVPDGSQEVMLEKLAQQEEQIKKAKEELSKPPQKIAEALKEMGEKKPSPEEMKKMAEEKIRAAVDKIPQEALDRMGKTKEDLVVLNMKPQAPPKTSNGMSFDPERILAPLRSERDRLVAGIPAGEPPSPEISGKKEQLDQLIASLSQKMEKMKDPEIKKKLAGTIRILHHFAPPQPNLDQALRLREQVTRALPGNRSFRDWNLRGADLSGLDLSETNFSEADLIGVNFSGSNLSGASFKGVWATHGNFSGCILDRTDFSGANLGCSDLTGVRGEGASFKKTILTGAVFTGCNLLNCSFVESEVFQTFFKWSRVRRGQFKKAKFIRAGTLPYPHPAGHSESEGPKARLPFEECDFSESDFSKALFMKIDFSACDLSGCKLDQANFLECSGPKTLFDRASLKKVAFPRSTQFQGSSFLGADLTRGNLRGVILEDSDFRGAILSQMDGSGGNFHQANLSGVKAIQTKFQKSDLSSVDARGGDFRQSLFLKADLRGADFSHGSLYKAGFSGAKIDASTLWDQALTGKTTLTRDSSA